MGNAPKQPHAEQELFHACFQKHKSSDMTPLVFGQGEDQAQELLKEATLVKS